MKLKPKQKLFIAQGMIIIGTILAIISGLMILFSIIKTAYAKPIVIHDSGRTIDAEQFYPFDYNPYSINNELNQYSIQKLNTYPIITKNLTPGKFRSKNLSRFYEIPICIVGYDDISIQWLTKNKDYLIKINTTCYVVNVTNEKEFTTLSNIVNIDFIPTTADDITQYLDIKHYPALIYQNKIQQ